MEQNGNDAWDKATLAERAAMICKALPNRKMDQERIKRLLEVVDPQDQIKLKVLHNAVVKCIKDYQAESTSPRLNDWQKAEAALEGFVAELWAQHFTQERTLPNLLAVVNYLSSQGWKIKKSTAYLHQKAGKIHPQADGSYRVADADKYASLFLQRTDGASSPGNDRLMEQKLQAEYEKLQAQAKHWRIRTAALEGHYVERDAFERELARRAAIFRNDLETFARSRAADVIALVSGDEGKVSDLIEYMLERLEEVLARYAEEREFTVPLPAPELSAPLDEDDDEEDE